MCSFGERTRGLVKVVGPRLVGALVLWGTWGASSCERTDPVDGSRGVGEPIVEDHGYGWCEGGCGTREWRRRECGRVWTVLGRHLLVGCVGHAGGAVVCVLFASAKVPRVVV